MKRFIACAGALALVLCSYRSASAVVIISTFDSSLEGWTVTDGVETFAPAGGNPVGYLRTSDNLPTFMTANAPAAFLGNLSSFDGGTISFDSKQFNLPNGVIQTRFGEISISNGSLTGTADFAAANLPDWTTFSSAFTAATFGMTQSDFTALLASVTSITLILDSVNGLNEIVGLDNFYIQSNIPDDVVPEPSSLALLALGLSGAGGFHFLRRKKVQPA